MDVGSRYPLAISISMLQVSWRRKSLQSLQVYVTLLTVRRTMILALVL